MKLQIKNKAFVVTITLLRHVIVAIVLLLISLFVAIFITSNALIGIIITLSGPIIYLIIFGIDASIYAKSAYVEATENTINFHSNSLFRRSSHSLPIAQINKANAIQPFFLKLFGLSEVVFIDETGAITYLWGFNYDDAAAFLDEFSSKYKIKFSK